MDLTVQLGGSKYQNMHHVIMATAVVNAKDAYVVGWFTLMLVNAGLAQSKGRSGLGWWAASFMLGPIATLLIVVREPVRK